MWKTWYGLCFPISYPFGFESVQFSYSNIIMNSLQSIWICGSYIMAQFLFPALSSLIIYFVSSFLFAMLMFLLFFSLEHFIYRILCRKMGENEQQQLWIFNYGQSYLGCFFKHTSIKRANKNRIKCYTLCFMNLFILYAHDKNAHFIFLSVSSIHLLSMLSRILIPVSYHFCAMYSDKCTVAVGE